jgi:hypothetical protein
MQRSDRNRAQVRTAEPQTVSRLPLVIGFFAGPTLWSLHELVSEILISSACSYGLGGFMHFMIGSIQGWQLVLLLETLFFFLLGVAAEVMSIRHWIHTHIGTSLGGQAGGAFGRSGWMYMAGILLSCIFVIAIAFAGVPIFFLAGCS